MSNSGDHSANPIQRLAELDKIVHEPGRFAILNALSGNVESADYAFLQHATGLTKSSLANHLAKLETAGLIEIKKLYVLRRPHTRVYVNDAGRAAVEDHWRCLEEIEEEIERWKTSEILNEQRELAERVKEWQALESKR